MGAASWERLVSEVKSHRSWKNSVAVAYFPEPVESLIQTVCGFVRVLPGAPGYEMNSGERIAL